jgi:hypothetical protein
MTSEDFAFPANFKSARIKPKEHAGYTINILIISAS